MAVTENDKLALQKTKQFKWQNKKICSARHSKWTQLGIVSNLAKLQGHA